MTVAQEMEAFSVDKLCNELDWSLIPSWQLLVDACLLKHCGEAATFSVNAGGAWLAKWIIAQGEAIEPSVTFGIMAQDDPLRHGDLIERIIAGLVIPEWDLANAISMRTGGMVLPSMFHEAGPADVKPIIPQHLRAPEPAAAVEIAPGIGVEHVRGALFDDVPSGPLFQIVADPANPGTGVLTGGGLALRLTPTAAVALRDAAATYVAFELNARRGGEALAA